MVPVLILISLFSGTVAFISWIRQRAARRAEHIRTFILPPGLYERLRLHHPHLSMKDCHLAGAGLRQFFMAYLKSNQRYVSMPSQVVDDLWHEFILYTRHYDAFCQTAFGSFLHHTPAVILGSVKKSNAGLRRCWWHVCREELINPANPARLPLLFALDTKLDIKNGFHYLPNCHAPQPTTSNDSIVIYCASDFSINSDNGGGADGFGDGGSGGDSGGSDCGGDGGGGDGGCGGGCGGGGE